MSGIKSVLTRAKKSKIAKEARKGHDFGKKNVKGKTGFKAVVANAEKEGKSASSAKKIAGAAFWKQRGK